MSEQHNAEIVISLQHINKSYKSYEHSSRTLLDRLTSIFKSNKSKRLQVLDDINLNIYRGETVGIIGRNGSGKSTLLNIIMGSIPPTKGGRVVTKGKIMRLALGLGVDPNLSGRDNIYVNGSVLGLSFKEIGNKFHDIIDFAGLEKFVDTPVKKYSSGMRKRLMFTIAMHAKDDVFLLDEFFGGTGDDDFRKKSDEAFQNKILEGNTLVIVSHNMPIIKKYCDKVIWLHRGKVMADGSPADTIEAYKEYFRNRKKKK